MKVELLYFDGCPNWEATDLALREALRRSGRSHATVDRVRVETPEQAEALRFVGSPTVLIDGRDPFCAGEEKVGLACRVFPTPAGLAGSPTVEQLIGALS